MTLDLAGAALFLHGRECPTCGHVLRLVLVEGRLVWFCPLCGVVVSGVC